MSKRKPLEELSPSQRKRYEHFFALHPDESLAAARGHKPPPPPDDAPDTKKLEYALRQKAGNIRLKETLGAIDKQEAREADQILREMLKSTKDMEKEVKASKMTGASSLEWELWSQQQKEREISLKELTNPRTKTKSEKAKKIIQRMQKVTEKMWTTYPVGTPEYYDYQDKLAGLYKRLENLGFVARTGDIVKGDVGYH